MRNSPIVLRADHGCQVLIGGSQEDSDLAQRILHDGNEESSSQHSRDGQRVKQFAAIAKRAALFVGSDSGAMHIAAAMGTPIVALFGPSNPQRVGTSWRSCEGALQGTRLSRLFSPDL